MVTRRNIGRADENSEEDGPVAGTEPDPSRAKPDVANACHYSGKGTGRGRHTRRRYRRIPTVLDGDCGNPLPPDFREPPLKDYDETTDPQAHVTTFKTQMLKRGLGDAIQYKLFSGTLSGAALIWFSHLPPLSVSGILDLLRKFLAQFSARKSRMMTSGKIFSIRKRVERSIHEGLVTQKAGKEQGHTFQQHTRAKKGYNGRGRGSQTRISWDDRRRPDSVSNYGVDTLTPLNTTRARILKEVYQFDLIRLPPQVEGPKGPDMRYLGRYIEKRKGRGDKDQRRDEEGSGPKRCRDDRHKETRGKEKVRGVVTTIAGGFTGGGETSSARRRYARQVMTIQADLLEQGNSHPMIEFTNEDFRGIQPHQDDPMVIDVLMAKY
ncbi:hypothetical protein SESBI_47871 [Sesbania bispinosa]|nr:hypothetical protein SESBI_47871 [Sesbania bispinosa]